MAHYMYLVYSSSNSPNMHAYCSSPESIVNTLHFNSRDTWTYGSASEMEKKIVPWKVIIIIVGAPSSMGIS